jgi:acetylornithine deacetylase
MDVGALRLDEERFLRVLGQMMAVSERLQNSPVANLVPCEDLAGDVVLRELGALAAETRQLSVERVSYVPGRGNLILSWAGRTTRTVAFVGAHLDVVPADPRQWERPPFALQVEGGRLYGRGVTDCLGHVAILTDLFAQLASARVQLEHTVVAVIIANEEASNITGVGIDKLVGEGRLDHLRSGPVYWIDSANFGPTLGTGGMTTWRLTAAGKAAHSGFPHDGINAAELAYEATRALQEWFYRAYPPHPAERDYGFLTCSSLKPTLIRVDNDTVSKIPPRAVVEGDIRLTPWYGAREAGERASAFIRALDVESLPQFGPSRFRIGDEVGRLSFEVVGEPVEGVACDRTTKGHRVLAQAIAEVHPGSVPFSLTGSLPYVRFLRDRGFDLQITGFGRMDAYHAPNEFAEMEHMREGFQVLCRILSALG